MRFTAIDFETANAARHSVCAVGLAVVEDGEVVETVHRLVRPPDMVFAPMNIAIHGIHPRDVEHEPGFDEVWSDLQGFIAGRPLVAHNAGFDMSVLRASMDRCGRDYPELEYFCTLVMSRRMWPERTSHKLNHIADMLGVEFRHHRADDDAMACACIALHQAQALAAPDLHCLAGELGVRVGRLYAGGYAPCRRGRCRPGG